MNAPPMRGGVQPPANKNQTCELPIRTASIPAQLRFALAQREADAIPCVSVGQQVRKGEVIAHGGRFAAPLHASTSGEIIAVDEHHITLRSDGAERWCERHPLVDFANATPDALIEKIRAAGVIGAGGAGFPAARKLLSAGNAITLIINGAECEPYITADARLMRERAADIAHGIRVLQHILAPAETIVGIEDENREALAAIRAACADIARVVALPSIYPIGGEGPLLRALTGREIPHDAHPADIGALCFNVGTAAAIHRAVVLGEPMLSRIVTVTGGACETPGNFEALIGTPLTHLLEQAGFIETRCATLIAGGGMMGTPLADASTSVAKTSHCFIAGTLQEFPPRASQPCIRCDYCADVCPAALLPQQLHAYARVENIEQLQRHNLFDCIECGACDYICPSQIALTSTFRSAKRRLEIIDYEIRQAPIARNRFAAHQQRIARERDEREQRRQQRLQHGPAARPTESAAEKPLVDHKKAAIQAAIARAKSKKSSATQRPAVVAALADDQPLAGRLQQRIDELRVQIASADAPQQARLQRALDDLAAHLADTEADSDTPSARDAVERALRQSIERSD